ncbi:MAG: FecR domain-containing protein [Nitrospinae bacterium]|nr:FecR domain-containing protein [Nitrospinota bacterium]
MRLAKLPILAILISVLLVQGSAFASIQKNDAITRGEFIEMLAQNQPDNSLLPQNNSPLSPKGLYSQVAKALKSRGINVLDNKSPDDLLSQQEFIRITYAFAGGQPNKTLFKQKSFLKNAGIISSTDIGITTGVDGKVYQTHKGQSAKKQIELAAPIFMDDQFETDFSSKALFTFDDESTLTMSEDTIININTHVYNPDKNLRETLIKASIGWIRFKVTKDMTNGSSFKVVTPTATAGVRGTEFAVIVNPQGKTTFVVLEGKIETFSNLTNGKGKTFFISAGEVQDFSPDGFPSPVRVASADFLAKVVSKTTKPKALLVAKGIGKGLAKLAAKNAAKIAKKAAKAENKLAKEEARAENKLAREEARAEKKLVRESAKGSAKGAAKDSAKVAAKGSAKAAAKDSAKLAAKDSAKAAAKDSAKVAAKDSAKAASKDSAKVAAKDSAKSAAKDSAKETAKQVAKENGNNGKGKGNG